MLFSWQRWRRCADRDGVGAQTETMSSRRQRRRRYADRDDVVTQTETASVCRQRRCCYADRDDVGTKTETISLRRQRRRRYAETASVRRQRRCRYADRDGVGMQTETASVRRQRRRQCADRDDVRMLTETVSVRRQRRRKRRRQYAGRDGSWHVAGFDDDGSFADWGSLQNRAMLIHYPRHHFMSTQLSRELIRHDNINYSIICNASELTLHLHSTQLNTRAILRQGF
jgi:hypothetical protein